MAFVEKRGDKKLRARYRAPDGRERSKTFPREKDARAFLTKVESSKMQGAWVDPRLGKTTVDNWIKHVVATRPHLRGATQARDASLIRNHLLPHFGATQVAKVTRADVQRWVATISEGLAPTTVRECYRLLGGVMAEAVEHRLVAESPCRRVRLPRAEHREKRFISAEDAEALADAFPAKFRAIVPVAVYTGARWEEIAGLKRANLDLLRRQMRIVGTIERAGGKYRYVEETKSETSRRTIRLPSFLVDIIAAHLERAPESDFVFAAAEGGFLRYDNFRRRVWGPAVRRAGMEPLTFHELRHTAAALMIDEGADPLQVQRRLGHKDIRTTLKHYGHLFPNREDDLNDALERTYRRAVTLSLAAYSRPESDGEVIELKAT
jgi:integrase